PIAGGDEDRLSLGSGLLKQLIEAGVETRRLAAEYEADADGAASAVGHALLDCVVKTAADVGANRSARRGRVGVVDVEKRLDLIAVSARCTAVRIDFCDSRGCHSEGAVIQSNRRGEIVGVFVERDAIRR